jgi:transcriptional regulator GlxA family with amidase domain
VFLPTAPEAIERSPSEPVSDRTLIGYESVMKRLKIEVGVAAGGPAMVPIGIADLLRKSSQLAATLPKAGVALEVELVGEELTVAAADGQRVLCDRKLSNARRVDVAIVPAVDARETAGLTDNVALARWARRRYAAGADVASVCTGAFVLAEAQLLSRRRATTHWAFQPVLASRFPDVRLVPQAIVVDEGRICTAGGATSFINLALYLVERLLGAEAARAASKMYLIDVNKAPQGAYAIFSGQKTHGDEEILRAQARLERSAATTIEKLAREVGMSTRTFARRFKLATGNTPRDYAQRVRVEAAKRALERTRAPLSKVAHDIGYGDLVAFRRIFAKHTGLTPADYRRRYAL